MSKRTAFSQKSEQKHWRLRHDREELERQQRRVQKRLRKAAYTSDPDAQGDQHDDDEPDAQTHARD